jgi:hypothetical protein
VGRSLLLFPLEIFVAKFVRIAALSAVAGALFVSQIGSAFGADASTPDDKPTAAATSTNCVGVNALEPGSVSYKVDGTAVTKLRGGTEPGKNVSVTFTVKTGCDDVELGLAAYQAPSGKWVPSEAKDQKLVDTDAGTFSHSDGAITLSVDLPSCYYQVDFFTGAPVTKLDASGGYTRGNLIDADNGGSSACVITTTTSTPPVTVSPNQCPTGQRARITDYSFTVGSKSGIKDLTGDNVKPGDTVKVDFTVAANCSNQKISLASYEATDNSFTQADIVKQVFADSDTGTFGTGKYSLSVKVPKCYFQVDFVTGDVITKFGPVGSSNFYGDRIIDTAQGGKECTVDDPPVRPTTTTSTPPTTVAATEVLGEQIVRGAPATASAELAHTGADVMPVAAIGSGLTLAGVGLQGLASTLRRRRK